MINADEVGNLFGRKWARIVLLLTASAIILIGLNKILGNRLLERTSDIGTKPLTINYLMEHQPTPLSAYSDSRKSIRYLELESQFPTLEVEMFPVTGSEALTFEGFDHVLPLRLVNTGGKVLQIREITLHMLGLPDVRRFDGYDDLLSFQDAKTIIPALERLEGGTLEGRLQSITVYATQDEMTRDVLNKAESKSPTSLPLLMSPTSEVFVNASLRLYPLDKNGNHVRFLFPRDSSFTGFEKFFTQITPAIYGQAGLSDFRKPMTLVILTNRGRHSFEIDSLLLFVGGTWTFPEHAPVRN